MKERPDRLWTTAVDAGSWAATASRTGRRGRVVAIVRRQRRYGERRGGRDDARRRMVDGDRYMRKGDKDFWYK